MKHSIVGSSALLRVCPVMVMCLMQTSCGKAPPAATPAPPPVAAAPATAKPKELNHLQKWEQGLIPGTENYEKRVTAEQTQELAKLEEALFAKIDKDWNQVLRQVQKTKVKGFDLTSIPQAPEAETQLQFQMRAHEIRQKQLAKYSELTQDPAEARDAALKFLDACNPKPLPQKTSQLTPSLKELGEAAIKAGSKDPLVRYYAAYASVAAEPIPPPEVTEAAYKTTIEAYPLLREQGYSKYDIFQAKYFAWSLVVKHRSEWVFRMKPSTNPEDFPQNPVKNLFAEMTEPWMEWLVDASLEPQNLDMTWDRMRSVVSGWNVDQLREKYLALLQKPEVDPWFVHMLGSHFHSTIGWASRGSGSASTVTDEGWDNLAKQGDLAQRQVLYAWHLRPNTFNPPLQMMTLTLTDQKLGTPSDWFGRAVMLRYDSRDAIDRLDWSLRPRWGGSIEQVTTLALACLNVPRFDTYYGKHGLELLIRIQSQEFGSAGSLFDDPRVLPALVDYSDRLNKAIVESGPGEEALADRVEVRRALAHLYIKAGYLPHARSALEPVVAELGEERYSRLSFDVVYWTGRALAAAAPELEEPLKRIDQVIENGASNTAAPESFDPVLLDLARVRKVFDITDDGQPITRDKWKADSTNPATAKVAHIGRFVRHVETAVERLKKFARGEWVELTVDDLLLGWSVEAARWEVTAPDTIQLTGDSLYLRYRLISLAKFEPPYDIQVSAMEVVLVQDAVVSSAGIALGSTATSAMVVPNGMRQFGIFPAERSAAVRRHIEQSYPPHAAAPFRGTLLKPQPEHLRVKVWPGGHNALAVNGLRLLYSIDTDFVPGREVTFGNAIRFPNPGTVKLTKMRIRKLPYGPPQPNREDQKEEEALARRELEFDPDDAAARFDLGYALAMQEKYALALPELEQAEKMQPMFERMGVNLLLGLCYSRVGRHQLAVERFQTQASKPAHVVSPALIPLMNREVAFLRATAPVNDLRNGKYAMTLIMPLNEQAKFANWDYLWVLATAHAELGEFEEATKRIREAKVLAPDDRKEFLASVEKLFEKKQPYRDEVKSKSAARPKTD